MRLLIIVLLIGFIPTVTYSQKLFSTYRIIYSDGDSLILNHETLQRSKMYKLLKVSNEKSRDKKISKITDSYGRIFEIIVYNDSSIIAENILDAPYTLYSADENNLYLKVNDSVYFHLYKDEMSSGIYVKESVRYKGLLLTLAGDNIELRNKINQLKFKETEIQEIVAEINKSKYPDATVHKYKTSAENSRKFNSVMLHGGKLGPNTSLDFDLHRVIYFPSASNSFSIHTGFSYSHRSGEYSDGKPFTDSFLSIPALFQAEVTNSILTPYFQGGVALALIMDDKYGSSIGLGWILGGGLRIKPTSNFNIRLGVKSSISGNNLDIGLEYFFPEKK